MNARLLLSVLFLGAFALAFYLIFSLWPHEEPEPEYAPDLQHEAMVAAHQVHQWIAAHTTTTVARVEPDRSEQNIRPARPARTVRTLVDWDALARCESNGRWHVNTGNGFYGGLQFALSSWRAVGGSGYPHEHSRETQIVMAERLSNGGRNMRHWPTCAARLGYL